LANDPAQWRAVEGAKLQTDTRLARPLEQAGSVRYLLMDFSISTFRI